MAIRAAELYVLIGADASKLDKELKRSVQRLEGFADAASSVGSSLTSSLTRPLLGFGRSALDAAGRMESLRKGLVAVAGSSAAAEAQLLRLKEIAKLPGLGMEEAAEGAVRLQAAGLSARSAERALMAFGNALASVGKGKDDLREVVNQLTQIASSGKIQGDELRVIAERVPQVRKAMIQAFGTADSQIINNSGKTAAQVVDAIVEQLERLPKVTGGWRNDVENARDTMVQSLARIGDAAVPLASRFLNTVTPAVEGATKRFAALPSGIQQNIIKFGLFVAAAGPAVTVLGSLAQGLANLRVMQAGVVGFFTATGTEASRAAQLWAALGAQIRLTMSLMPAARTGVLVGASAGAATLGGVGAGIAGLSLGGEFNQSGSLLGVKFTQGVGEAEEQARQAQEAARAMRESFPVFDQYMRALERLRNVRDIAAKGGWTQNEREYVAVLQQQVDRLRERAAAERGAAGAASASSALGMDLAKQAQQRAAANDAVRTAEELRKAQYLAAAAARDGGRSIEEAGVKWEIWYGKLSQAPPALQQVALAQARARDAQRTAIETSQEQARLAKQEEDARKREIAGINDRLRAIIAEAQQRVRLYRAQKESSDSARLADELRNSELAKGQSLLRRQAVEAVRYAESMQRQAEASKEAAEREKQYASTLWGVFEATKLLRAEAVASAQGREVTNVERLDIQRQNPTGEVGKMTPEQFARMRAAAEQQDAAQAEVDAAKKRADETKRIDDAFLGEKEALNAKLAELADGNRQRTQEEVVAAKLAGEAYKALSAERRAELLEIARQIDQKVANARADEQEAKAGERMNQVRAELAARLSDVAGQTRRAAFEQSLLNDATLRYLQAADPERFKKFVAEMLAAFDQVEQKQQEVATSNAFARYLDEIRARMANATAQMQGFGLGAEELRLRQRIATDEALNRLKQSDPAAYAAKVKELMDSFKQMARAEEMVALAQSAADRMATIFADAFTEIGERGFGGLVDTIKTGFLEMLRDMAAQYLKSTLYRVLASSIGSFLPGFGGGAAGTPGIVPGRAFGGPVEAGTPYKVGDHGRAEVFVPRTRGYIYPSVGKFAQAAAMGMGAGGGGQVVNHNTVQFVVYAQDAATFRKSQPQIMSDAYRELEYQQRRGSR